MFAFTLVFIGLNATAQTRYIDNVFDSVTVTSDVVYGQNVTILPMLQQQPPAVAPLLCDIYEPKNDTLTDRPVIILMHTGSFLPAVLNGQATGSKCKQAEGNTRMKCKQAQESISKQNMQVVQVVQHEGSGFLRS